MTGQKVTSPDKMAVIFAEILGNLATVSAAPLDDRSKLDEFSLRVNKAWNAVEHFIRSLCFMGGIALTAGNMESLKRAWMNEDAGGLTFKEKISQLMRGQGRW